MEYELLTNMFIIVLINPLDKLEILAFGWSPIFKYMLINIRLSLCHWQLCFWIIATLWAFFCI